MIRRLLGKPRKSNLPGMDSVTTARDVMTLLTTHELSGFFMHTITQLSDGAVHEGRIRPDAGTLMCTILYADGEVYKRLAEHMKVYEAGKLLHDAHFPDESVYAALETITHAAYALRWLQSAKPGDSQRFLLSPEGTLLLQAHRFWRSDQHTLDTDGQGGYIIKVRESAVAVPD